MPPKERHKLQPRNFEARPPGQPSSGLHMGYGGGQRPAVSYSSERGGPSDEYLKNPMGGGYEPYLTKEPTQTWNLMPGLGMVEKGKDIYNKFRPELNDGMLNFNLGDWKFGIGRDKIGFGYNFPFQKTSALDTEIGGTDEYKMADASYGPQFFPDYYSNFMGGNIGENYTIDIDPSDIPEPNWESMPDLIDWKQGVKMAARGGIMSLRR